MVALLLCGAGGGCAVGQRVPVAVRVPIPGATAATTVATAIRATRRPHGNVLPVPAASCDPRPGDAAPPRALPPPNTPPPSDARGGGRLVSHPRCGGPPPVLSHGGCRVLSHGGEPLPPPTPCWVLGMGWVAGC